MTLKTPASYFAAHCPQWYFDRKMPTTFGGIRDELIRRKMIPAARAADQDVTRSFTDEDTVKLQAAIAWDYAALMISMGQ